MRTATIQQVPNLWPEILRWMTAGEEVQLTEQDRVIATLVPTAPAPVDHPDFLARAKSIWGENPAGTSLSEVVSESRGGSA